MLARASQMLKPWPAGSGTCLNAAWIRSSLARCAVELEERERARGSEKERARESERERERARE
eukprot:2925719-Alexandrium_andersonii.AAC.1